MNIPHVFIGPTLQGISLPGDVVRLPPAEQGDIAGIVVQGAKTIVLIDGLFTQTLAPWHKEILFALKNGCRVIGAGSLGAIRAAECARYGMEPVGEIAGWYASGTCYDDAEVALAHACEDDGYAPLTIPLVNIRASAMELAKAGIISDVDAVVDEFRGIHYSERSLKRMQAEKPALATLIEANYVDQKSEDALLAINKSLFSRPAILAETPKNDLNDYMAGLLTNDIKFPGEKRPWEKVSDKKEAVDHWLMSEMAMALGLTVNEAQISKAVSKCWENLGVFSSEDAESWANKNSVTNEQFNRFAIRDALIDAARDWIDSVSRGRDSVPISYEYQLLTQKPKNINM
jgi:hypothetical protein